MSTIPTSLIRLAVLLLTVSALAKCGGKNAGRFRREVPAAAVGDRVRGYLLSRKISGSYCRSQLKLAGQNATACLELCKMEIRSRLSVHEWKKFARRRRWFRFSRKRPCMMRCWHHYRLVLRQRGDAYDQMVASTGCNATTDQLACRETSFHAAQTADLSASLTSKQRYEKIVCEFSCGQMFTDPAAIEDCKANCELKQLINADAYKKLCECTAQHCEGKTGEELADCKRDCLAEC